jgi:hypothetical protein
MMDATIYAEETKKYVRTSSVTLLSSFFIPIAIVKAHSTVPRVSGIKLPTLWFIKPAKLGNI